MVSPPGFTFHTPTAGMGLQNTGISALDHNADRVIGRDSRERWKDIRKRVDHKRRVLAREDASGFDLSRQVDGDYRVMAPQERAAADRARNLHKEAVGKIKTHMEERKNS